MKIIMWSDFVCPFCYVGIRNLEEGLKRKGYSMEDIEFEYRSFQLEPGAKYVEGRTYKQAMMERKNAGEAQIDKMFEQISMLAKQAGLTYHFDTMKLTDTFPAHRLFQYAKEEGKGYDFFELLYEGFFLNGELISDSDFLINVGKELGLDADRTQEIVEDETEYKAAVEQEIQEAGQVGAQGVPFFVFNDKYGLSGAQPPEIFEQVLTQVEEEFAGE